MPVLARLSASGNGVNANGLEGIAHAITGTNLWVEAGLLYQVIGIVTVNPGSELILSPGVEIRFPDFHRDLASSIVSIPGERSRGIGVPFYRLIPTFAYSRSEGSIKLDIL